jgi:hypothetical protein
MPRVDLPGRLHRHRCPKAGKRANLVSISGRQPSLSFTPNAEALRGFPLHHPIQSIRRCQPTLIGGDETKPEGFSVDFASD